MPSRASISVVLVRPLAAALTGDAVALRTFFASTDLTPELLSAPEGRVSPAQFCVAWAEAVRLSGDAALALRIAEATPPGAFGVVEYVCRSAATVREALRQWVRYLGILDDAVDVALVDIEGGRAGLRVLAESDAPVPASHELCFGLVVRRARELMPGFRAAAVHYAHRAGAAQLARHRAFFDCPVRFGATHTELVLDQATLDAPLVTANPNLLAVLLPAAEAERAKPRAAANALVTDQVRRALRVALSNDDAQLDSVARRLGMTARSLQRRLKDEGAAFQALRDATRRDLADRYLGEGMALAEISFLLGFSEPSAFFRAFKRWTGRTPFERRAALPEAHAR